LKNRNGVYAFIYRAPSKYFLFRQQTPGRTLSSQFTPEPPNAAWFSRPQGAFGVRQLAAAFENVPMCLFFKDSPESGSEQPHISKGSASPKTMRQYPNRLCLRITFPWRKSAM
jgi:hypothetical protein